MRFSAPLLTEGLDDIGLTLQQELKLPLMTRRPLGNRSPKMTDETILERRAPSNVYKEFQVVRIPEMRFKEVRVRNKKQIVIDNKIPISNRATLLFGIGPAEDSDNKPKSSTCRQRARCARRSINVRQSLDTAMRAGLG
jgi:hypothetical protein